MIHPDRMFHRFIFLFVFNIKIGEIQNVKYLRTKQITKKGKARTYKDEMLVDHGLTACLRKLLFIAQGDECYCICPHDCDK